MITLLVANMSHSRPAPARFLLMAKFLLLVLALSTYSQCKSFARTLFTDPKVTVENVVVRDVALSGVTLDVTVAIDNPNSYGVDFSKLKYKVFIEGEELLKGETNEKSIIDGKKKNFVTLPLEIKYKGLKSGISGVFNKKKIHYKFTGVVVLDTKVGNLSFDVEREGDIPIPDRPKFSIEKVSLKEAGFTSATLDFEILVSNNHDVQFLVKKILYRVKVNDIDVSAAEEVVSKSIGRGSEMRFHVPVNIRLAGLKDSFVEIVKSGRLKYKFDLDLQFDSKYGPYNLDFSKETMTSLY